MYMHVHLDNAQVHTEISDSFRPLSFERSFLHVISSEHSILYRVASDPKELFIGKPNL